MKRMTTLCLGLALFTGTGALSLGQASAAPLASLGATIDVAAPKVELVGERRGDWWRKHGRHHRDERHSHFHEGLWFQFPFWLGATAAPYYADSYYDDYYDDADYGEDFYDEDYDRAHYDYCFGRYRSYDPGSNTFMGYDGMRHPCISPYG